MCIFAVWDNIPRFDIIFGNQTNSNEEDAEKSPAAPARRTRHVGKHDGRGLQKQRHHVRSQADQQGCHREIEHQSQGQQQSQRPHNALILKLQAASFMPLVAAATATMVTATAPLKTYSLKLKT